MWDYHAIQKAVNFMMLKETLLLILSKCQFLATVFVLKWFPMSLEKISFKNKYHFMVF